MSTNSRIGILHRDGTTETISCHWDGYPEHQMPILTGHYDTAEKVRALLALGDISSIGERLAPDENELHSFNKPADGVTVAYHRDRGELLQPSVSHRSIRELKDSDWSIDWIYLFDEENEAWFPPIRG